MDILRVLAIAAFALLFATPSVEATFFGRKSYGKKMGKKAHGFFSEAGMAEATTVEEGSMTETTVADGFAEEFVEPEEDIVIVDEPVEGEDTLAIEAPVEPETDVIPAAYEPEIDEIPEIPDEESTASGCVCAADSAPVCCDGVEYPNPCEAECAGLMPDMCIPGACEGDVLATPAPLPLYGDF